MLMLSSLSPPRECWSLFQLVLNLWAARGDPGFHPTRTRRRIVVGRADAVGPHSRVLDSLPRSAAPGDANRTFARIGRFGDQRPPAEQPRGLRTVSGTRGNPPSATAKGRAACTASNSPFVIGWGLRPVAQFSPNAHDMGAIAKNGREQSGVRTGPIVEPKSISRSRFPGTAGCLRHRRTFGSCWTRRGGRRPGYASRAGNRFTSVATILETESGVACKTPPR
jgi:hypothetical protein